MGLPQAEMITALLATYKADTTLQGLMTGASAPDWNIFDAVPTNTPFPYVVLNTITGSPGTALTLGYGKAKDLLVQIDIFSRYAGFKEAQAIASRIDDLTDEQPFTLSGGFVNYMTLLNNTVQTVEPDGLTRRVMLRYKFLVQG
jgi:hypothetical protein